jgi:hypothetical protein
MKNSECPPDPSQVVVVKPGNCSLNTWSWDLNNAQHPLYPDTYYFEADYKNTSVGANIGFTIDNPDLNPDTYITLDHSVNYSGHTIFFSGISNTEYGSQEKLIFQISSDFNNSTIINSTFPVVFVRTGNLWNFTLDTSMLSPDNYTVTVASSNNPNIGNSAIVRV